MTLWPGLGQVFVVAVQSGVNISENGSHGEVLPLTSYIEHFGHIHTMPYKHLYDSTDGIVLKALQGAVALNPSLCLDAVSKSVYLHSNSPQKRVAVIAGGGAGHEPAHAGYTGTGMLTACVSGDVFASPTAKQILTTIKFAAFSGVVFPSNPRDVLVIINNYTGDRLNFGLAIEKARIEFPGVKIDSVIVADDISLLNQSSTALVGPRGLAGNILVCKLIGALAETGVDLKTAKTFGDLVVQNLSSVGMGLEPCHIPGRAMEGPARLGSDEYELGLGLHNEAGVAKRKLESASKILENMVTVLLDVVQNRQMDETVLFVNNLGGMSQLEMGAAVYDIVALLEKKGFARPRRIYCSSYMTSLNVPGFSISLLNGSQIHEHMGVSTPVDIYGLLDAATTALAWVGARSWHHENLNFSEIPNDVPVISNPAKQSHSNLAHKENDIGSQSQPILSSVTWNAIRGACVRVLEVEHEITLYDTLAGDGDCGETFAAGAKAILKALEDGTLDVTGSSLAIIIRDIADILEDVMGGTIGALFGIFLNALSSALSDADDTLLTPLPTLSRAIQAAITALERYTPAQAGDRTIMDALQPFCSILQSSGSHGSFVEAVQAAQRGAEGSRGMQARVGRAAYLTVRQEDMPPDAGAWGVGAVLGGILQGLGDV